MIRAKFYCTKVSATAGQAGKPRDGELIELAAVYSTGDNDPNKSWSKWTPSGQLTIHITNPEALGKFEPGKCYFLDIAPADE
jgi:hypothetical protein